MKNLAEKLSTRDFLRLVSDIHVQFHWGQSGEDVVLQRFLAGVEDGFYVDVGAHHPRLFSNTHYLHKYCGWTGINIDATAEKLALFERERPDDVNLNLLVGDEPGSAADFAVRQDSGLRNKVLRRGASKPDGIREIRRLEMRTLVSVLDEHLPAGQTIQLLSVDCEGLDLAVLKSNDWQRYRPEFICVEDFAIRHNRPSATKSFLDSVGYAMVSHCYDSSIYAVATPTQ